MTQEYSTDIVQWLMKNLSIEDPVEAIHVGSLIAAQGYIFPISDHVLTMKDDGTFYRFQAPYFWPSNCWEPENTDYAIYLCKRTMQNKARLELADYEAENLARLQRAFARKWEFIFMQAEAQVKIDRKKDKTERKILDSQERAFWDVHRPVPGCVNTTEMDIRKCRRLKNPQKVKKSVYGVTEESQSQSPVHIPSQPIRKTTKEDIRKQITFLSAQIDRHCLKMSKVAERVSPRDVPSLTVALSLARHCRNHTTLPHTERSTCLVLYLLVCLAVLALSLGAICAAQLTAGLIFYHHLACPSRDRGCSLKLDAGSFSASRPSMIMKCN